MNIINIRTVYSPGWPLPTKHNQCIKHIRNTCNSQYMIVIHNCSRHICWAFRAATLDGWMVLEVSPVWPATPVVWTSSEVSPVYSTLSVNWSWDDSVARTFRGYRAWTGHHRVDPVAPTWMHAPLTLPSELLMSFLTLANFQKVLGWSGSFTRTMSPMVISSLLEWLTLRWWESLSSDKYSLLYLAQKWFNVLLRYSIVLERSVGELGTGS